MIKAPLFPLIKINRANFRKAAKAFETEKLEGAQLKELKEVKLLENDEDTGSEVQAQKRKANPIPKSKFVTARGFLSTPKSRDAQVIPSFVTKYQVFLSNQSLLQSPASSQHPTGESQATRKRPKFLSPLLP